MAVDFSRPPGIYTRPLVPRDYSHRVILDLCGGTGSWSRPYRDAGYTVHVINTPEYDVKTYEPPANVYGILAAPPCTMFSMARRGAKEPRDLKGAMEVVNACLRIIQQCQYEGEWLKFWALENPKGLLRKFLGSPALTFNPHDFGEPWTKQTDLWGIFNSNLRPAPVEVLTYSTGWIERTSAADIPMHMLPPLPAGYVIPPDMNRKSARRSITPAGFAKSFFRANP